MASDIIIISNVNTSSSRIKRVQFYIISCFNESATWSITRILCYHHVSHFTTSCKIRLNTKLPYGLRSVGLLCRVNTSTACRRRGSTRRMVALNLRGTLPANGVLSSLVVNNLLGIRRHFHRCDQTILELNLLELALAGVKVRQAGHLCTASHKIGGYQVGIWLHVEKKALPRTQRECILPVGSNPALMTYRLNLVPDYTRTTSKLVIEFSKRRVTSYLQYNVMFVGNGDWEK